DSWEQSGEEPEVDVDDAEDGRGLRRLQRAFQSAVFADVSRGGIPEQPLDETLYAAQVNRESHEDRVGMAGLEAYAKQQAQRITARQLNPEVARIFNESGFSLQSCELLDREVRAVIERSEDERWLTLRTQGTLRLDDFADLLRIALL